MAITIEEVVLVYVAAWNENDETARRALLDMCWADNGSVTSNYEHIAGRESLVHSIDKFRHDRPDDRAILTSGIEHHHGWFRFTAIVVRPNGTTYSEALDISETAPDGRIRRIITFHEPLPAVPDTWPGRLVRHDS